MPEMIPIPEEEWSQLKERARKLAMEKSYLQLVIRLMNKVSDASGRDDTVSRILSNILDVIGGGNVILYYWADHEIFYEDVYGRKQQLERIDDELVNQVISSREALEVEHDFSDTLLETPEFGKAYTWVYPLMVGEELVGVIKMDSLHIGMREMYQQLLALYSFVALILKNDLASRSRLKQAYAALEQEVAVRKRAEEELRLANATLEERVAERTAELQRSNEHVTQLNRELRAISNCNQTLMHAVDEQALLDDICHIVCDQAGYRMAWVGYVEHDEARSVRPVAWAGVDDGYLAVADITWADTERGRGPTGTAIRTGESVCIQDFTVDPEVTPWREMALQRGYRSSITLPLKDETGTVFGAFMIYSTEPNIFTLDEVRLLEELAGDLAFGICVLRDRIERSRAEEQLRASEEKYRTLIQKLQTAVVVHAADTRIVTCNAVAQSLLGLTEDQLMGKTAMDPEWHFIREDGSAMPMEAYPANQVLATRRPLRNLVVGVHRPGEAQDVWVLVNANPVLGRENEISEIIVTFVDITERKQAEEEMRARNDELVRFNQAATGRELRMIDLKREINELCGAAGQPPRYKLDFTEVATPPSP